MTAALAEERVEWGPQEGPQAMFAECEADLAIYGGAAGGGKSWALLYEAAKWAHVRGYRAVLFRRTVPELTGGGGLWDESADLYSALGGRSRSGPAHLDWTFASGARVEFRHMQRVADRKAHQGRQYAFVGFDELTHFEAAQFWYLVGRLRSACGVRPYLRGTCNPDPDSFVAELVKWWLDDGGDPIPERSGVIRWLVRVDEVIRWYDSRAEALEANPDGDPLSFTFISAKLADNRILTRVDPTYRAKLSNLGRVDRARLLGGNWKIREGAGLIFKRSDFVLADEPPSPIVRTVRTWDLAALPPSPKNPDPDWTRGVRVSLCADGELWIDDLRSTRTRSAITLKLIRRTAAGVEGEALAKILARTSIILPEDQGDGPGVIVGLWQDPGGAGVIALDTVVSTLAGFPTESRSTSANKIAYAKVWAPLTERGRVYVKRAPWTRLLLSECDGFPEGNHDDIVDAINLAAQLLLGSGLGFWGSLNEAARRLTEGR